MHGQIHKYVHRGILEINLTGCCTMTFFPGILSKPHSKEKKNPNTIIQSD